MRGAGALALANAAGKIGEVLKERMKVFAQSPKGFNDAGKDGFALGNRVAGLLIKLSDIRGTAGLGKGTLRVPLGQRVTNGGVDKKFLSCWCHSHDIHNGVPEILGFKWIEVVFIVDLCGCGFVGGCGEFRNRDLPVDA